MTKILVYDIEAEIIEKLADDNDMTIAEAVEIIMECIDDIKLLTGLKQEEKSMAKRLLTVTAYAVSVLLLAWVVISFFDITSHNLTTCKYWEYNLFILLGGLKA